MLHPSVARAWANTFATTSRRAFPTLPVAFTLGCLLDWMQTNDPNGEWTPDMTDDPPTMDEALEVLCDWAADSWADFIANPGDFPVNARGFIQWTAA